MNRAASIYWDNSNRARPRTRPVRQRRSRDNVRQDRRVAPWWISVLIVFSIFAMLTISVNYHAFTEVQSEIDQNSKLVGQVQNLLDENLALQEEIYSLKTNPEVIRREAQRIGINLKSSRESVPSN